MAGAVPTQLDALYENPSPDLGDSTAFAAARGLEPGKKGVWRLAESMRPGMN